MYIANGITNGVVYVKLNLKKNFSYAKVFIDGNLIRSAEKLIGSSFVQATPNQFDDWESCLICIPVSNGSHELNVILTDDDGNHDTGAPTIPFWIENSFECAFIDSATGQLGTCTPDELFGYATGYVSASPSVAPQPAPVEPTPQPVYAAPVQPVYQAPESEQPSGPSGAGALVFGILGLACCDTVILGIIFSIIGLVKAASFKRAAGSLHGTAKVGRILSIVGLILSIFMVGVIVLIVAAVLADPEVFEELFSEYSDFNYYY